MSCMLPGGRCRAVTPLTSRRAGCRRRAPCCPVLSRGEATAASPCPRPLGGLPDEGEDRVRGIRLGGMPGAGQQLEARSRDQRQVARASGPRRPRRPRPGRASPGSPPGAGRSARPGGPPTRASTRTRSQSAKPPRMASASVSLASQGRARIPVSSAVRPAGERGQGADQRPQRPHEVARGGHEQPLVQALRGKAQAGRGDRHDGAGAVAGGELDADASAEGVAEHVHALQSAGVEVGLHGVGRAPRRSAARSPTGDSPWPGRSTERTSKCSASRGSSAEKSSRVEPMPWSSRSGSPWPARSDARRVMSVCSAGPRRTIRARPGASGHMLAIRA